VLFFHALHARRDDPYVVRAALRLLQAMLGHEGATSMIDAAIALEHVPSLFVQLWRHSAARQRPSTGAL
jgi:hypothetical protein